MSWCECDDSTSYRVTGEVVERPPLTDEQLRHDVGSGEKTARVRCVECGGKVGAVGSDLLELVGIPNEKIRASGTLGPDEYVTIEIDLI